MATDVRYFTHDHNARHDSKIEALIKKYGMEGYGRFWVIIETMRESRHYKLVDKQYVLESLSDQMKCSLEELNIFLEDCVNLFELFIKDDSYYYSESLVERMSKLEDMRDKKRRGAYAMHDRLGHNVTKDPEDNDI